MGRTVIKHASKAILPYLFWIVIAIIVIIVLIGIVAFILMSPSIIRDRAIQLVNSFWADVKGIFIGRFVGQAEAQVDEVFTRETDENGKARMRVALPTSGANSYYNSIVKKRGFNEQKGDYATDAKQVENCEEV